MRRRWILPIKLPSNPTQINNEFEPPPTALPLILVRDEHNRPHEPAGLLPFATALTSRET